MAGIVQIPRAVGADAVHSALYGTGRYHPPAIRHAQGLNITVQSYMDKLDFGFIVDRDLVPDVWDLADMHIEEIARLLEATGTDEGSWARDRKALFIWE